MAADSPSVFAAVLHYGVNPDRSAWSLLADTLDSLRNMRYGSMTLAVVDNGSTDGSRELLRDAYPGVELFENGENLGVSEGYNVALREGRRRGFDWVCLLNNDIIADPDMLSRMVEAGAGDPAVGIVGPKAYFHAAPETLWYAGGNVNFFTGVISHRGIREIDRAQYDRTEDTGYVNGCAMLVRREVIDAVGLFDPAFRPAYAEDADYSLRALRAGFRLVYAPKARLWHRVSASSGGGATPLKTRLKVEHNFLVLRRHARWYHWLTIPWCIGATAVVFVARELLRGNLGIVAALGKGFLSIMRKKT